MARQAFACSGVCVHCGVGCIDACLRWGCWPHSHPRFYTSTSKARPVLKSVKRDGSGNLQQVGLHAPL